MTILSAAPQDPTGYGRVMRKTPGAAEVEAIVEQNVLKPAQESVHEINSGIYAFKTAATAGASRQADQQRSPWRALSD